MADFGSILNTAASTVGGALSTAGRLAGALNNLSNPAALISSLRSINLPKGGESGSSSAAGVSFGGADASNDWRVRLAIPPAFSSSPMLSPLVQAGGLVFPYTPSIAISSTASYGEENFTHSNYGFVYYQNSKVNTISINGAFNVEDGAQAMYWLAAVHCLRSATKMFTGEGDLQGNPPPIFKLNGYGDYVFKNIPVVIESFSINLPADTNYINTSTAYASSEVTGGLGGALSSVAGIASASSGIAAMASALGANKVANVLGTLGTIGGAVAGAANLLSGATAVSGGGSFATSGNSWVPVKSELQITVRPIYSREAVRRFSLQKFVKGDYVNGGYV